jgi:ferrous-iron efflux pump FieF
MLNPFRNNFAQQEGKMKAGADDSQNQATQQPESGRRKAGFALVLDFLFFAAKLIAGILTGSLSLVALAVFSGIDILKSAAGPLPVQRPPVAQKHKFNPGLYKIAPILMLVEGVLFILAAVFVFREAGRRLEEGLPPGQFYPAIIVTAVYLLFVVLFSIMTRTSGKNSLRYSWIESGLSLAVLAVLIAVQIARIQSLDPVISIFICVFVLYKSLRLLLDALKEILDNRLPPREVEWIKGLIQEYAGHDYSVQDLSVRQSGNKYWIDFHLAVSDAIDLEKAYRTAGELEKELIRRIPGAMVIIHVRK